jgi:hypothetical protein
MSRQELARDDAILATLRDGGPAGSVQLAAELGFYERRIRRGLRQLIKGGYVFSPLPGQYRITAVGVAAIEPVPPPTEEGGRPPPPAIEPAPPPTEQPDPVPTPTIGRPPNKLYDRFRSRR